MYLIMQTSHEFGPSKQAHSGFPTLTFAWAHFAIALTLGISGLTAIIPPVLGIFGMAFFAGIAMIFALLTLTR